MTDNSDTGSVKYGAGFGATDADFERGYLDPGIQEKPEYELANYRMRASVPKPVGDSDEDFMPRMEDIDFRMKDRVSKGFIARPYPPNERT